MTGYGPPGGPGPQGPGGPGPGGPSYGGPGPSGPGQGAPGSGRPAIKSDLPLFDLIGAGLGVFSFIWGFLAFYSGNGSDVKGYNPLSAASGAIALSVLAGTVAGAIYLSGKPDPARPPYALAISAAALLVTIGNIGATGGADRGIGLILLLITTLGQVAVFAYSWLQLTGKIASKPKVSGPPPGWGGPQQYGGPQQFGSPQGPGSGYGPPPSYGAPSGPPSGPPSSGFSPPAFGSASPPAPSSPPAPPAPQPPSSPAPGGYGSPPPGSGYGAPRPSEGGPTPGSGYGPPPSQH